SSWTPFQRNRSPPPCWMKVPWLMNVPPRLPPLLFQASRLAGGPGPLVSVSAPALVSVVPCKLIVDGPRKLFPESGNEVSRLRMPPQLLSICSVKLALAYEGSTVEVNRCELLA